MVAEAEVLSLPLFKNNFSKTSLIPVESYVRKTQVLFSHLKLFCPPAADSSTPEAATETRTSAIIAFLLMNQG